MEQDNFIQASIAEREKMTQLFNKIGINSFYFTNVDGYDKEDGYFTGRTGTPIVFEVKNRDITSTEYKTIMIGEDKIKHLLQIAKTTNNTPYVFWFFNDGTYCFEQIKLEQYYITLQPTAGKAT